MDEEISRCNQRNRERETNRETNRRNNMMSNAEADEDDDSQHFLSLSLGSTSYSRQIPASLISWISLEPPPPSPSPSPSFDPSSRPPPMTTGPYTPDAIRALMVKSYQPFDTMSPPLQSLLSPNNSLQLTGPRGSSSTLFQPTQVNFYPPSAFAPPPNQITPARPAAMRPAVVRPAAVRPSGIRIGRRPSARFQNAQTIPPPYPWATNRRGVIQTLEYLEAKQITNITGKVQCKHCDEVYQVSYNLRERFEAVEYIIRTVGMRNRALKRWENPDAWRCELCGREKSVKPVIAERKSQINWLFLLLGQALGFCTLEQLKNFCKHMRLHRTGAKDRVLYLTYMSLCSMLQPNRELFRIPNSKRFR